MSLNFSKPDFSAQTHLPLHKPLIYVLAADQPSDRFETLYDEALQGKEKVQIARAEIDLKKAVDFFTFVGGGFFHSLPILAAFGVPGMISSTLWVAADFFNEYKPESEVQHFASTRNRDAHTLLLTLNEFKGKFKQWYESTVEEVALSDISSEIKFPAGYPWTGKLYRQHPFSVKSNYYYPVDSYYSMLLDEREHELVQLLADLGAVKIWIRDEMSGRTQKPEMAQASSEKSETASLNRPPRAFELPRKPISSLAKFDPSRYLWLASEPNWQALVNARLNHGCTAAAFDLNIDFSKAIFALLERIEVLLTQLGSTKSVSLDTLVDRTLHKRRVYVKFAAY